MDTTNPDRSSSLAEFRDGVRDLSPAIIAASPIGLLFGAVAASKGLSTIEVASMSALVFAGGAQFAAIEIWTWPVPIAALTVSTLLINLRHVLMGASLAPRTGRFSTVQRLTSFAVMADENWAFAERRAAARPLTFAYFGGAGAVFWANWLVWSTLGALAGPLLGNPATFGADFAFTALFIGLVVGFGRAPRTLAAVVASGLVAAGTYRLVGPPWHVAAGGLAGILAAYLVTPRTKR